MFMYIFGGTLPALNAVSSAAYDYGEHGDAVNIGLMLHASTTDAARVSTANSGRSTGPGFPGVLIPGMY